LIYKAHDWLSRLTSGRYDSVQAIATEEQLTSSYVTQVIQLAFLAPDITIRLLNGQQPVGLTSNRLLQLVPLPMQWDKQSALLNLSN
jgi:hypothetical protein